MEGEVEQGYRKGKGREGEEGVKREGQKRGWGGDGRVNKGR